MHPDYHPGTESRIPKLEICLEGVRADDDIVCLVVAALSKSSSRAEAYGGQQKG